MPLQRRERMILLYSYVYSFVAEVCLQIRNLYLSEVEDAGGKSRVSFATNKSIAEMFHLPRTAAGYDWYVHFL